MQVKNLPWKRVATMTLFVLMVSIIGATKANAHHDDLLADENERAIYSFSAICPSGQRLYYKITDEQLHYVSLYPKESNASTPYGLNPPTGDIILPETVVRSSNNITYTVTGIHNNTFNNCVGLTGSLVIPNTVTTIGSGAFAFCSGFTSLTLSESLTSIGAQAFYECTGLQGDLTIPNGVTSIQSSTFWNCTGLTGTLTLPESLTYIGANAFEDCHFTGSLILPNTLETISDWAFKNNNFTGDLIIPNSVTTLKESVFEGCSGFNGDLVIPGSFTSFYPNVFKGCSNIQAIYYYATTLPTLETGATVNNIFSGINGNIPFYVPNTSTFSSWTRFTNKQQRCFFVRGNDADWNNTNNWVPSLGNNVVIVADCDLNIPAEVNKLTIISQYTLSVKSGNIMSVNSTITNRGTAANLIIEDGGQLMHHQDGLLATVQKNIIAYNSDADGWYLISASLAGNTDVTGVENLLTNTYDLYYYDEPTYYWINQKLESNNFTQLECGKGYLYANSDNVTLGFAGALKNGTVDVTIDQLSYEGAHLKGFNLIGNPYAHNINSLTTVDVENGCYRMNGTLTDLMVSVVSAEQPLKPAEGIFVKATSANASVTFNTANTRTETEKTGSICVEVLENGKISDRLLVKRNEGNDFEKISLKDNRTKIFATKEKEELAIVVCNNDDQAINFKTVKNGAYTLSVTLQNMEADYLHLIDNLTGNDVDLLANPTYTFEAKTTDYTSRFRLVFSPEANENGNNESFAFIANDEFIIANQGVATLQVIDLTGRILSTETINGSFNKPINMSKGVYMLRLINDNNVKTQKIVVE